MEQIASVSTVEDGATYRQVNLVELINKVDKGEPYEMAAGTQDDRDQSMQRRIESLKVSITSHAYSYYGIEL